MAFEWCGRPAGRCERVRQGALRLLLDLDLVREGDSANSQVTVRVENLLRILLRIRLAEIVRVENRPRVENPTENLDDSQPGRFSANPDGHRGVG